MTQSEVQASTTVERNEIVIRVAENGSTGYHWEVAKSQGCKVSSTYEPPLSGRIGESGVRNYDVKFEDGPGSVEISLNPPGMGREAAERITIVKSS